MRVRTQFGIANLYFDVNKRCVCVFDMNSMAVGIVHTAVEAE